MSNCNEEHQNAGNDLCPEGSLGACSEHVGILTLIDKALQNQLQSANFNYSEAYIYLYIYLCKTSWNSNRHTWFLKKCCARPSKWMYRSILLSGKWQNYSHPRLQQATTFNFDHEFVPSKVLYLISRSRRITNIWWSSLIWWTKKETAN